MATNTAMTKSLSRIVIMCLFVVILLFDRSIVNNYVEIKAPNQSVAVNGFPSLPSTEAALHANQTDWFQRGLWKDMCFSVEHVCHSTGRWWYNQVPNAHQPNFQFNVHKERGTSTNFPELSVRQATEEVNDMKCSYSPIPNHLVLYSFYNEMLGEFYVRILVGFIYMLSKEHNAKELLENTQLYLHLFSFDRRLLESHYAFMAPFLSHRLLNFKELLQSTSCTCAERMVFCGYDIKEEDDEVIIKGAGGLEPKRLPGISKNDPRLFRGAQRFIRENVIDNNPFVQRDIAEFRKNFLTKKGIKENFDDWKIIGLTQRSGRRRWLNIDESVRMCEEKFRRQKMLCMVVNVEEPQFHPTHHVVVHGSLDGLIGVHGAQLTDALWMKPGSLVVELLTYLAHDMSHGAWTRRTTEPTPLGEIYVGIDLYHVGLPLKWTSVPQCATQKGPGFKACLKKNLWAERDFNADTNDVQEVIAKFARDRPDSCEAQRALAGNERFVLYNALCDDGGGDGMGPHFFYWKRGLEKIDAISGYPGSS